MRTQPVAAHREPGDIVAEIERDPRLSEGPEERFVGYGVMAAPFRSGDLLAMRRFPAASIGQGYTSVWHRAPNGTWTFYSDREPLAACPRYFGSAIARSIETPIDLRWPDARHLEVRVPAASLEWRMELEPTRATRALNAIGGSIPERMWHSPRVLAMMSRMASRLLHAGHLALSGQAPNGQWFVANPRLIWVLRSAVAKCDGRPFGDLAPLPEQVRLGDFWIPQRGLFAIGRAFFEAADPARHHLVAQADSARP